MHDFIEHSSGGGVVVASPDAGALAPLLVADGVTLTSTKPGRFEVRGLPAEAIGDIAAGHGFRLHELTPIAAAAFTTVTGAGDDVLGATAGAIVLATWVAVTLGASIAAITRRDV